MTRTVVPPSPADAHPADEFSRPLRVADLPAEGVAIADKATEPERAALAARYGIPAVARFAVSAELRPVEGGWRLSGVARAKLRQTCVVTLEEIDQTLEEPFARTYLAGADPVDEGGDLDPDADDPPEPLGEVIDPAEAAAEAAALAIDPYPRGEGVVFTGRIASPLGAEALTDAASRPFAALAALKDKMGGGES